MELKQFIRETLVQIVAGVKEAQDAVKDTNAEISPTALHYSPEEGSRLVFKMGRGIVQFVEFDVAVSTTEAASAKGGLGIFVGEIGIGAKGQVDEQRAAVNRIKFSVPLLLPSALSQNRS